MPSRLGLDHALLRTQDVRILLHLDSILSSACSFGMLLVLLVSRKFPNSHLQPVFQYPLIYVVATHPDADHIGGLIAVLNSISIGEFITLVKYIKAQGIKKLDQYNRSVIIIRIIRIYMQYLNLGQHL